MNAYKYGYGYVYILSSPEGYYKIGCTSDPLKRVDQIQPKLPFKVKKEFMFHCAPGQEQRAEQRLHSKFRSKRTNGEWFRLDAEDIKFFYQNPIPIGIALSHSMCFAQECLKQHHDEHLLAELLGLS